MEFQWDPLDFPNQIQSNPMKIPWNSNEQSNENQWNSMEFNGISNEIQSGRLFRGGIHEIPSKVLLTFWGGGGYESELAIKYFLNQLLNHQPVLKRATLEVPAVASWHRPWWISGVSAHESMEDRWFQGWKGRSTDIYSKHIKKLQQKHQQDIQRHQKAIRKINKSLNTV